MPIMFRQPARRRGLRGAEERQCLTHGQLEWPCGAAAGPGARQYPDRAGAAGRHPGGGVAPRRRPGAALQPPGGRGGGLWGSGPWGGAGGYLGVVFGSADNGRPMSTHLGGFNAQSFNEITLITATPWFAHLDTSNSFAARDYTCPARMQGLGTTPNQPGVANPATPGAPGLA